MKRSEINKALKELEAMCEKYHCYLPPFCHVTPAEWQEIGHEYDEVRDCMLGWDITDYGMPFKMSQPYTGIGMVGLSDFNISETKQKKYESNLPVK